MVIIEYLRSELMLQEILPSQLLTIKKCPEKKNFFIKELIFIHAKDPMFPFEITSDPQLAL
jgi:hypothetical protein